MPPDLDAAVAEAASAAGTSYSGWIANVARKELTMRAGLAAVAAYEREEGQFSAEELAQAEEWAIHAVERSARSGARRRQTA